MRLLLDENVGIKRWARLLREAGHDVERVVDVGMSGADDDTIVAYATEQKRAIISRDKASADPDDLKNVWQQSPKRKPLLLLIYPDADVGIAEITRAVANVERAGINENVMCGVVDWAFS